MRSKWTGELSSWMFSLRFKPGFSFIPSCFLLYRYATFFSRQFRKILSSICTISIVLTKSRAVRNLLGQKVKLKSASGRISTSEIERFWVRYQVSSKIRRICNPGACLSLCGNDSELSFLIYMITS
ncbi:hypothetical protein AVEN_12967-1 [Araneus ventricosus]|uniref:Uncharacterized protein n=1 Tax=Araneus ventricosus TaxID=182803 RepID=A0A4Y2SWQ3_ARAVE|nr:hypothetical protein AVEN_12967-1 [Araneus ventricosus]